MKITERELKHLIKESIMRHLNESAGDSLKRGDLGWVNGFSEADEMNLKALRDEARCNGWKVRSENVGHCDVRYTCDEGGWSYRVCCS